MCGDPAALDVPTVKVIGDPPLFHTLILRAAEVCPHLEEPEVGDRLPVPRERDGLRARCRERRHEPGACPARAIGSRSADPPGLPVFTIAAASSSLNQPGWACLTSAATPATCGDAIDVPEFPPGRLPVPIAGREDAHSRRGDPRLEEAVAGPRPAGREAGEAAEVRVRDGRVVDRGQRARRGAKPCAVRRRRRGEAANADERDGHRERHAVSGFEKIGPSNGGKRSSRC